MVALESFLQEPSVVDAELQRGEHFYIRGETIVLRELLARGIPAQFIHIYCEELQLQRGTANPYKCPSTLQCIFIYARSLFVDCEQAQAIVINTQTPLSIFFYYQETQVPVAGAYRPTFILNGNSINFTLDEEIWEMSRRPSEVNGHDGPNESSSLDPLLIKSNNFEGVAMRRSSVGRQIRWSPEMGSSTTTTILPSVPSTEFMAGTGLTNFVKPPPLFLPAFLENLFWRTSRLIASSERMRSQGTRDRQIIASLRFIILCSRSASTMCSLCQDSQELLRRIETPQKYPKIINVPGAPLRLDVPVANPKTCLGNLAIPLALVQNREKALNDELSKLDLRQTLQTVLDTLRNDLQGLGDNLTQQLKNLNTTVTQTADRVLEAIGTAQMSATSLSSLFNEADAAGSQVTLKEVDFAAAQSEVNAKKKLLDKGMEKYKEDQKNKLIMECVKASVEITISVGVAVYTAGAGGPATAAMVADAAKGISNAVSTMDKVKQILKKILELAIKLGPKLYGDGKSMVGNRAAADLFGKGDAKQLENAAKMAKEMSSPLLFGSAAYPIDYLGILADWEEFKIDNDEFFDEVQRFLGSDSINGMREYRTALRKYAVRGETLLQARKQHQDALVAYQRAFAEAATRLARKAEIEAMKNNISQQGILAQPGRNVNLLSDLSSVLRLELAERIKTARRQIVPLLYDYAVSVLYENCLVDFADLSSDKHVFRLTSNMSSDEVLEAEAAIQDVEIRGLQHLGPHQPDGPTIVLDTSVDAANVSFEAAWKDVLISTGQFAFVIQASHPGGKGFCRTRLQTVKVKFQGLKPKSGAAFPKELRYYIYLGPVLEDHAPSNAIIQYMMPVFQQYHRIDPATGLTEGPGTWVTREDDATFVRPTVFCQGHIELDDVAREALDLTVLEGISITFTSSANVANH